MATPPSRGRFFQPKAGIKDRKSLGRAYPPPAAWIFDAHRFFLDFTRLVGLFIRFSVNPVVAILSYHKVGAPPPEGWSTWNYTPLAEFETQVDWFAKRSWTFLSGPEFVEGLKKPATLPPRGVLVTFDDAYASLETSALPLLLSRGLPSVVFLPTDLAGQGNAFDEGIEPAEKIADWPRLREWEAAGCLVQSHGTSHRSFEMLGDEAVQQELTSSREAIEMRLGHGSQLLAYPYGHAGRDARRTATWAMEAGYMAAFAYGGGAVDFNRDPERYRLPRLAMGPGVDPESLLRGF